MDFYSLGAVDIYVFLNENSPTKSCKDYNKFQQWTSIEFDSVEIIFFYF